MNRIEQALKRAEADASGGPALEVASTGGSRTLDDYPPERPVAVDGPDSARSPEHFDAPQAEGDSFPLSSAESERLVGGRMPPTALEQYRRLAAALHHLQRERGTKLVMVASAAAGEGKTLTATNLALTLSESYRRQVLLVDADLRCPMIHRMFGIAGDVGLSQGLRSAVQRRLDVTRITATLAVLPGGTGDTDPMGVLTSSRMRAMLQEAGDAFEWVVLDTPPVALLADANLLAAMVDAAVLVVRAGATPYHLVRKAIDTIGRQRIIGAVLNCADPRLATSAYYYEYYSRRARQVDS